MLKGKVRQKLSRKDKQWLKDYLERTSQVIDTPFDYSNDGRKEEEQARDNERNHEVIGRDGRMK